MTFARLIRSDAVAMVAALALLLVMAMDWYGTTTGDEARRVEKLAQPHGALGGEVARRVKEDARFAAQAAEKNPWQEKGAIDRVILVALLLTAVLALAAGYLRAAARRFEPPLTPSALAAIAATVTALLVTYRIIQEPGFDESTTVKPGAPLALIVLGVIALSCRAALRAEEEGTAWREPADAAGEPAEPQAPEPAAGGPPA